MSSSGKQPAAGSSPTPMSESESEDDGSGGSSASSSPMCSPKPSPPGSPGTSILGDVVPCPDCGQKEGFTRDAAGVLTCRCGLSHAAPASLVGGGAPQPVRRTASGGRVPVRRTASGGSGGRGGGGKKKPSRVQEWLAEVAKRLSGVPRFVLTDAHAAYARTLKDTSRRGCTDLGLALASLEFALQKSRLERPRAELCAAASERVSMPQLTACAKVVRRQNAEPLPDGTPTVAHFVARLCDELKQRGQYAKAAAAVAARTVELGAGRACSPSWWRRRCVCSSSSATRRRRWRAGRRTPTLPRRRRWRTPTSCRATRSSSSRTSTSC